MESSPTHTMKINVFNSKKTFQLYQARAISYPPRIQQLFLLKKLCVQVIQGEQLESIFLGGNTQKKFGKINKGNEFYPDSRARNRRMRPQPEGARGIVPPPRRQPRQAACGQAGGGR